MPPPPLPEAFTDPAQEWNTEDTWGSQGDQQQLSSQQVYSMHSLQCNIFPDLHV
jgi:hypothetical protein